MNKTKPITKNDVHETTQFEGSTSWLYWFIPPIILSFITGLFYHPSLNYNFQFDDVANINKFFYIRYLTFDQAFFTSTRWIPFWLNAVNYRLGMFKPYYYRLTNISLHITAGVLVFFLIFLALSRLKKDSFFKHYNFAIACCTAALFMLHPVQTQTISYVIQGRLEGLAGLFVVAMIVCFIGITRASSVIFKSLLTLLLVVLTFFACGTKEIFIVAPLLLLLVDWFFVAQGDWQSLKKRLPLHIAIALIIILIFGYFYKPSYFVKLFGLKMEARNNIGNVLTEEPGQKIYPLHFFISQFKVILHYLFMFVWPFSISVEYDWKLVTHFFAADCILPLCALIILASIVVVLLRKDKINPLAFGALWFLISVAPRSSIIPSSELLADYKTYLASIGILFILACGIVKLFSEVTPHLITALPFITHARAQYALIFLMCIPMGFMTLNRNKVWRSSEEFWSNIIENAPGKARAYNNLAVALSEKGKIQESIPLYKKAIAMDKNYPDPWNNLAVAYSMNDKLSLAIDTLKQAIRIHNNYPEAYNNLASFYITKKDFDNAEKVLNVAIQMRPHYGKAFYNLGKIALERGKNDLALEYFKTACTKCDLDNEPGFQVYANAAINMRKYDDAEFALRKLLVLNPDSFDYVQKFANILLLNKKYTDSALQFHKILRAQPSHAQAWYNLAECYLQMKEPGKALEYYKQAIHHHVGLPQAELRIAACLQQLGRIDEAKTLLTTFMHNDSIPANIREVAKSSLLALDNSSTKQEKTA